MLAEQADSLREAETQRAGVDQRTRFVIRSGPVSDMLQFLAMMAVVIAFFGTIRYLNLRAARSETAWPEGQ